MPWVSRLPSKLRLEFPGAVYPVINRRLMMDVLTISRVRNSELNLVPLDLDDLFRTSSISILP